MQQIVVFSTNHKQSFVTIGDTSKINEIVMPMILNANELARAIKTTSFHMNDCENDDEYNSYYMSTIFSVMWENNSNCIIGAELFRPCRSSEEDFDFDFYLPTLRRV